MGTCHGKIGEKELYNDKIINDVVVKLPPPSSDKKSAEQTTISVNERLCEDYFCKKLGEIGGKDISRLFQNDKIFISYAWEETGLTNRHATDLASYLKLSGFKTVIFDGDSGSNTLPGLLKHLETIDIIIVLVTSTLNQKLNDLANTHVIRDEINVITKKLVDTEWKGQIIPILLQGTKESLPNTHPLWSTLVYEDFTSVFESKLVTDESQDYYDRFFSLLERLFQSIPLAKPLVEARRIAFRAEVKEVLQLFTKRVSFIQQRQVFGGDLPILSNFIYGREATIEKSQRLLEENKRLILSGMAGVGKTSIGLKVMEKMNFQTIWFMDTKDSEIELLTIYKRMVCDEFKIQMNDEKEMDIPGKLETILRNKAKQSMTPLLIVFENVDHDALRIKIEKEFIFKEISDMVFVMILTRCDVTGTTKIPVVNIPLLNDDDATRLLFHYSSSEFYQEALMDDILEKCKENISKLNENDHNALKQLAIVLLGKHPLAITLAGSAKREFYSESWTDLKTKWTDLLSNVYSSSSSLDDPRSLVAPSIRLSIDHLNEEQLGVLQNISFWGSRETDIPLTWVSESSQISILVSLKRLNLVQELVLGAQSRVSCHSLVAESAWSNLSSLERINVGTHCIQLSLEEDSNLLSIESRKQRVNCLSYLVVENSRSITHDASFSSLLKRYGKIAYDSGMYRPGIPLYQLALDIDKNTLGEHHVATATTLHNLAKMLKKQGKFEEARPLYDQSLAIRRMVLGDEHVDVAESLHDLAELLVAQGKFEQARPLHDQSLTIREKALGTEHQTAVAESLNSLANLLSAQGKYEEARPLYDQSLALRKKIFGAEHADVAVSLNDLALLLVAQGRYEQAKPYYIQATSIWKKLHGDEHPLVATGLNNLAQLLSSKGEYFEAEKLVREAMLIDEKVLGPDHVDFGTDLVTLGDQLKAQGKHDEAKLFYERALHVYKRALGDDHSFVATTLNNLALLLYNQGKYDEARPLYDQSLAIRRKALGQDHPDVAQSLNNLAVLLRDQGEETEARKLGKQAYEIVQKSLGENHPDTINYKYWESF